MTHDSAMAASDPLVDRLLALLMPLGAVTPRRLFSGFGLYLDGTIFAILFDGKLFLKADDGNRAAFERRGLGPFTYEGHKGRTVALPYWEAPPELLEDGRMLCRWARAAHQAGLRFNARKTRARPGIAQADRAAPSGRARAPRHKPDF